MKTARIAAIQALALLYAMPAEAQSKEDLLGGTPLDTEAVYARLGAPDVANSLAACGAGKVSPGSATITVAITPAGEASLESISPKLPPDVGGCIGGVISSVDMPTSGTGGEVSFVFNFPAAPPGGYQQQPQQPQYDPRTSPEFLKAHRMRKAGLGLLIPGCIFTGLFGMGFALVVSTDPDDKQAFRALLGLTVVGLALLIPGAVLTAKGSRDRREALRRTSAAIPLPGLAYDPHTGTGALTLTWRL